jgi:mannose-1-phosphate guanylyltransferase
VQEKDPGGVLLVLPADHLIGDVYGFHDVVRQAARLAASGALVTFGITPDQPATGYVYIERGDAIGTEAGAFRVARFVEKPDRAR